MIVCFLGVQIGFFHTDLETLLDEINHIVRGSLSFSGIGIRGELLSPRLSGQLKMILTAFASGFGTELREGEDSCLLQSGILEVGVDEKKLFIKCR